MKRFVLSFLCALMVFISSSSAFASNNLEKQLFTQNFDRLVNQETEYAFLLTDWNLAMYQPLAKKAYTANRIMDAVVVDTFHLVYTTNPAVWNRLVELFGYYDYYEEKDNTRHRFPAMFARPRQLSNGKILYTMAFIKMSYYNEYSFNQMRNVIAQNMKNQDLFDKMSNNSTVVLDVNCYNNWRRNR